MIYRVVMLGATEHMQKACTACERAGVRLPRTGQVPPGRSTVLILDLDAFDRLTACFGSISLAAAAEWLFVVGGPETNDRRVRAINEVEGIFISSGDPEPLALALRRILGPQPPPAEAGAPGPAVPPPIRAVQMAPALPAGRR